MQKSNFFLFEIYFDDDLDVFWKNNNQVFYKNIRNILKDDGEG
jgi:hypothetical protein